MKYKTKMKGNSKKHSYSILLNSILLGILMLLISSGCCIKTHQTDKNGIKHIIKNSSCDGINNIHTLSNWGTVIMPAQKDSTFGLIKMGLDTLVYFRHGSTHLNYSIGDTINFLLILTSDIRAKHHLDTLKNNIPNFAKYLAVNISFGPQTKQLTFLNTGDPRANHNNNGKIRGTTTDLPTKFDPPKKIMKNHIKLTEYVYAVNDCGELITVVKTHLSQIIWDRYYMIESNHYRGYVPYDKDNYIWRN